MDDILDIAVGVLAAADGRLLVAKRRVGTPGAGCWEFPGGKREPGEAMIDTLSRELAEEIGVRDLTATPIIRFSHALGAHPVRLHVWRVDSWSGEPSGREGQQLAWVERAELADIELLPATDSILQALYLPARYAITPSCDEADSADWWQGLDRCLTAGVKLLRLRDHDLDDSAYRRLARHVVARAHAAGARVLLDRDAAMCAAVDADGLHWPVDRLVAHGQRPAFDNSVVAVSTHSAADLEAAVRHNADFAVLSPVAVTPTHPDASALGWAEWARIRADHALPVYALGGLGSADIAVAHRHNAQGVAAIRAFWG